MNARDYEALAAFLSARQAMPFEWGRGANDCGAFAGEAVLAQTGRNPLIGLRWSGKAGALRLIARAGGLGPLVADRLREVEPALAQRGDIALARSGQSSMQGEVLMVIEGQMLIGPGSTRAPRSAMLRAFSAD